MRTFLGILALSFIAIAGCKKEPLPKDELGEPVFYAKGDVNGVPVTLTAGQASYQMVPTLTWDSAGYYVIQSELSNKTCGNCPSFRLRINDANSTASNAGFSITDALHTGEYSYRDKQIPPSEYQVELRSLKIDINGTFAWTVTTESDVKTAYTGSLINVTFAAGKSYTVELSYTDIEGCQATHKRIISPSNLNSNIHCQHLSNNGLDYTFHAVTNGFSPTTYSWNFGDGQSSTEKDPSHTYTANGSYYTAVLTTSDDLGNISVSNYQIPGTVGVCLANFDANMSSTPVYSPLSKVILEWTDAQGKTYSSENMPELSNATFSISSVGNYDDYQGMHAKQFKINFSCDLMNGSDVVKIRNGEAKLAAVYK